MHNRANVEGNGCQPSNQPTVGDLLPEVRMSVEEYLELIGRTAQGASELVGKAKEVKKTAKKLVKRKGKKDPKMAKALKKANQIGRTKSGKLRKGYTQGKIMRKAHQIRRKM